MSSVAEEEEAAILEFLSTFTTLRGGGGGGGDSNKNTSRDSSLVADTSDDNDHQGETILLTSFHDLTDGVILFEALSEIAPDYFDPTSIGRHLGDNWALKASNWRKLVRQLIEYYKYEQHKQIPTLHELLHHSHSLQQLAKQENLDHLWLLLELVAAAAVTCPNKSDYIQRILSLSADSQGIMKGILERSLARLSDLDDDDDDDDDVDHRNDSSDFNISAELQDDGDDDENELVFGMSGGGMKDGSTTSGAVNSSLLFPEEQVSSLQQEVALLKSQHDMEKDDWNRASEKLQALLDDTRDRLLQRSNDLIAVEEELSSKQAAMEQLQSQLSQALHDKAQLADDLEIVQAKAAQLARAEATLAAYKKKLESQGNANATARDLEDQAAQYIKQIVDLEAQVKKSSNLNKTVQDLQDAVAKLERERKDLQTTNQSYAEQVDQLRNQLQEAERARKLFADEAAELRAQVEIEASMSPRSAASTAPPDPQLMQRLQHLEAENKQLREMSVAGALAQDSQVSHVAATSALQAEIQRLQEELAIKERENVKISSDKDKLEAYTKRTLAKFQDKYLVALQECKTKLKEKQDKIEALENRSASERTAQKREERLLSSTIYELGLAIMQNRLKER